MKPEVTTKIYLDESYVKKNNTCSVYVRVTFARKKRYYKTKYSFTKDHFERLFTSQKLNRQDKADFTSLIALEQKAIDIINDLSERFSWGLFEKYFYKKAGDRNNLFALIEEKENKLRGDGRISTAVSYSCANVSLKKFHGSDHLSLYEVTTSFLNDYKKWMRTCGKVNKRTGEIKGNSNTTIGIYLRNVRSIFNDAISDGEISKDHYPFKDFVIPTGRNIKKALQPKEITAIYNYKPSSPDNIKNINEEKARDFWILSYLANGINMKDIALLKMKNIDRDIIRFERAKTSRANEDKPVIISFHITPEIKKIISRWGTMSINKEAYIFPILSKQDTPEVIYKKIQQLVKFVNNYMRSILKEIKLDVSCTTYVSRHSFASFLKFSGKSTEYIAQSLGHSDIKTTQAYLTDFQDESIRERGIEVESSLKAG